MTDEAGSYEFDVALSFAGEDRDYVAEVARALKAANIRYFLDSEYLADTWGADLVEYFDAVYRKRAKYAILFISRDYAEKMWPREERRSALARAIEERGPYILPLRLDDTQIDGLRPTVGYVDPRRIGIDGIVKALNAKLSGTADMPDGPITRAPRDVRETTRLLTERPSGWEYAYLAGTLHQELAALAPQYRDHELHYSMPSGAHVDADEAVPFLTAALDEVRIIVGSWPALMNLTVLERAVGAPGEPGDPDRIHHLAMRWTSVYEGLMRWAVNVRGTSRPTVYDRAFDILASFADRPVEQYREFADLVITQIDRTLRLLISGEPIVPLQLTLTLSIDDEVAEEWGREMEHLEQSVNPPT